MATTHPSPPGWLAVATVVAMASSTVAFEPGFASGIVRTAAPPRGWRSWNFFQCNITQSIIQQQVDAVVLRKRLVDGKPTSLLDLGYSHVGLDDCWQDCLSPESKGFHDPTTGIAKINTETFPDMAAMVKYGTSKGVTMGFYFDNCRCHEHPPIPTHYSQDAHLTESLGYGGVKIDSCGNSRNMTEWASRFTVEGRDLLVESCGNGAGTNPKKDPTLQPAFAEELRTTCPYSFYRVSVDVAPQFYSTVYNMNRAVPYLGVGAPLSRPGCWAYPDMLEVGVRLSYTESETHFAMWSVVSSPLILGFDLTDEKVLDEVWPIISNPEVLNVSSTWAGSPGRLVKNSSETMTAKVEHGATGSRSDIISLPTWQIWAKAMGGGSQAVLLVNIGASTLQNVSISLSDLGLPSKVTTRNLWSRRDGPDVSGALAFDSVDSHSGAFLLVTPA